MSLVHPLPLAALARDLRSGQLDLLQFIDDLCDRIDAVEPTVQALLPEPDRRNRLLAHAQQLLARFPDPATRPPLFGVPIGVKDIFHAEGF
ncbi:MAG: amidase, partial [Chloroflexi bacterium]|nr:amidase [Chloroflexota bacterium]